VRELRKLAAGPPERRDLTWLCRNAEAVLEGRDVVVHAIPFEDSTAGAAGGLLGWHPRTGEEIWLTTPAVLGHVEDFGSAWRRLDEAIAAATAQTGARRVIRRPVLSSSLITFIFAIPSSQFAVQGRCRVIEWRRGGGCSRGDDRVTWTTCPSVRNSGPV